MEKSDALDTDLPSISGKNNECISVTGGNTDTMEHMDDADLPKKRKENDETTLSCQEVSKAEECNPELPQCTTMTNAIKKCAVTQKIIGDDDQNNDLLVQKLGKPMESNVMPPQHVSDESHENRENNSSQKKIGKYFYYDSPLFEETGVWIPVSVPPLSEQEHEEWARGFHLSGGFFPEDDLDWSNCNEENKELTMWDVLAEMLYVARGKVTSLARGDIGRISWISTHLMEQAWKEMAETLTEANFNNTVEIVEADPPKWLPDSAASACMLCGVRFHPIMCTRHHCRFCGGIFCSECSRGRSLLPTKFATCDPERVCDVCCVRLECVQPYLMDRVTRAAQLPTHDVTDLSTLRSWLNFPWGQSMEDEIYKATNIVRGYIEKVLITKTEKAIPDAILRQAKGLAIITVMKVGMMVTYNIGTGIVIARKDDGFWSAPSAISSFGVGWGAQAGGELIDLIVVLRTSDAVKTFSGEVQLSVGASLGAAVGIVGRTAEAGIRVGTGGGCAAFYTYSCSKVQNHLDIHGNYVEVSLASTSVIPSMPTPLIPSPSKGKRKLTSEELLEEKKTLKRKKTETLPNIEDKLLAQSIRAGTASVENTRRLRRQKETSPSKPEIAQTISEPEDESDEVPLIRKKKLTSTPQVSREIEQAVIPSLSLKPLPLVHAVPISQIPLDQEQSASEGYSNPPSYIPLEKDSTEPIEPTVEELIPEPVIQIQREESTSKIHEAAASPDSPEDPNAFLDFISKFDPLKQPTPRDASKSYEATALIDQLKQLFAVPVPHLSTSQIAEVDEVIKALLSNASNLSLEQIGVLLTNQADITNHLTSLQLLHQEISQDEAIIQSYDASDSSLSKLTAEFQSKVFESNALEAREQRLLQELAAVREEKRVVKHAITTQTREIKQVMDHLKTGAESVAFLHKNLPLKEIRYQLLVNKWESFKAQMNLQ